LGRPQVLSEVEGPQVLLKPPLMPSSLNQQGPNQALEKGGRQTNDQHPRDLTDSQTKIKTEPGHHPNRHTVNYPKEKPGGQPIIHFETSGFSKIPNEPKDKSHPETSVNRRFYFGKTPASQNQALRPKPFDQINHQRINQPIKKIEPMVIQTLSPPFAPRSFSEVGSFFYHTIFLKEIKSRP